MRTPDSKARKMLAIAIYTLLIVWLIYSQHKIPSAPAAAIKQTVVTP